MPDSNSSSNSAGSGGVKIVDILRPFDGTSDVIEWFNKVELVAKLRNVQNLESVVPLFLEGKAFSVYNELSDSRKGKIDDIKTALFQAFSLDAFQAYEQFSRRVWLDESVDVYLSDLRRLARLANISSDVLILRAFVVGLPTVVSRELRATSKLDNLSLDDVVARARALVSELVEKPVIAVAENKSFRKNTSSGGQVKCFKCGGPHLIKYCPKSDNNFLCFKCGKEGHFAKNCTSEN